MPEEWLDVAYFNDEAILHGRIIGGRDAEGGRIEQQVRVELNAEQRREIERLHYRQQDEMTKLLRGFAAP